LPNRINPLVVSEQTVFAAPLAGALPEVGAAAGFATGAAFVAGVAAVDDAGDADVGVGAGVAVDLTSECFALAQPVAIKVATRQLANIFDLNRIVFMGDMTLRFFVFVS